MKISETNIPEIPPIPAKIYGIDIEKEKSVLKIQRAYGLIDDVEYSEQLKDIVQGDYESVNTKTCSQKYEIKLVIDYKDDRFQKFMADFTKLLQAYYKK